MKPIDRVLERLQGVRRNGAGWTALCPSHEDRSPSLSVSEADGGNILLHCFVGCTAEAIVEVIGLELRDLFAEPGRRDRRGGGGASIPPNHGATAQPSAEQGCTLEQYAEAKQLAAAFLSGLGLSDMSYLGKRAVRIPYMDTHGSETAVRFRLALAKAEGGDNRFRWRKGDKPSLYGLWRLRAAIEAGWVVLVEGESDCHTLWHYGIPAVGVPGADNWNEDRDAGHFDEIPTVYLVREPDRGGNSLLDRIAKSRIRDMVRVVSLGEFKDPSGLHVDDPARFRERFQEALDGATPWVKVAAAEGGARRREAWERCEPLARLPRILDAFAAGSLRSWPEPGSSARPARPSCST